LLALFSVEEISLFIVYQASLSTYCEDLAAF
jgi:hypothetical protein